MFVYVPPPPSPEAKALAAKIAELVRILRSEDPDIDRRDVEQALRLAQEQLRAELGGLDTRRVAIFAGLLSALAGVGVFVAISDPSPGAMLWIAGAAVILVAVALVAARRP
jgi:hypothetical protein